jgi:FtsP/CotA-like multicopper oxidase with cupredoxin domain
MARFPRTAPMARFRRTAATSGTRLYAFAAAVLLLAVGVGALRTLQAPDSTGVTRVYYIGADAVLWNYTPTGTDEITGTPLMSSNATVQEYTARNATYLGTSFEKCVYQQFEDASFTTLEPRPASQAYLGLLGPVIYAAVGDTVDIWFHNSCPWPESIAPEGVQVAPSSDGTNYNGSVYYGGSVPTNGTVEYTWQVPPSAGPGNTGASATLWLYQSGDQLGNSTDLGLVGPILISAQGEDNPNGTPSGSATNVILLLSDLDENNSTFLRYNVEHFAEDPGVVDLTSPAWVQSLNKYSINGFLYGNLPLLSFPHGAQVDWWLLGSGEGYPTATWQGNPILVGGARASGVPLVPDVTTEAVMGANSSGTWIFGSGVLAQSAGGMQARYLVEAAGATEGIAARVHPAGSGTAAPTGASLAGADLVDLWGVGRWV